MKPLYAILISAFCILPAAFATDVKFDLNDPLWGTQYSTNRKVLVWTETLSAHGNGFSTHSRRQYITDTNGSFTISNIVNGLYGFDVRRPPDRTRGMFLVTTNESGTVNVTNILAASAQSTFPEGEVAWAATASDARYAPIGSVGGEITNGVYGDVSVTNGVWRVESVGSAVPVASDSTGMKLVTYDAATGGIVQVTDADPTTITHNDLTLEVGTLHGGVDDAVVNPSGFSGNLTPSDNTVLEIAQALDALTAGLADNDYGDVVVSGGGAAMTVENAAGNFNVDGIFTAASASVASLSVSAFVGVLGVANLPTEALLDGDTDAHTLAGALTLTGQLHPNNYISNGGANYAGRLRILDTFHIGDKWVEGSDNSLIEGSLNWVQQNDSEGWETTVKFDSEVNNQPTITADKDSSPIQIKIPNGIDVGGTAALNAMTVAGAGVFQGTLSVAGGINDPSGDLDLNDPVNITFTDSAEGQFVVSIEPATSPVEAASLRVDYDSGTDDYIIDADTTYFVGAGNVDVAGDLDVTGTLTGDGAGVSHTSPAIALSEWTVSTTVAVPDDTALDTFDEAISNTSEFAYSLSAGSITPSVTGLYRASLSIGTASQTGDLVAKFYVDGVLSGHLRGLSGNGGNRGMAGSILVEVAASEDCEWRVWHSYATDNVEYSYFQFSMERLP